MFRFSVTAALLVAVMSAAFVPNNAFARNGAGVASYSVPSCDSPGAGDVATSAVPRRRDDAPAAPAITARAAVVIDGETGRVLFDLNAHQQRAPASTTKIMTAILAIEHGGLDRTVISDVDGPKMTESSIMGLRPGVAITMRDLLYGLMLPSGNDAAVLLAESIDGSVPGFVAEMNEKAQALGLRNTHFQNPHGLDARRHYSSAYDLAWLGRYAMANPTFAQIAGTQYWHLAPPSDYDLTNGNSLLLNYPGADGIKIGWTDRAGWTLVGSAVRDGRRLFVTVLDSDDRDGDAAALLDWAYASYGWMPVTPATLAAARFADRMGVGADLVRSLSVCG